METDFFVDLTERDRIRIWFITERGDVQNFTVQYETIIDDMWYPVVRYDGWHGQPHRDSLDRTGHVRHKDWLQMSEGDALTYALDEVRQRWQQYREDFLRGTR